ncbi:hypothetical protein PRZ48_010762 [Zasmidium cellare]|uniref:Uncharacterized protein n=1 Tax=Zasmidium cellare TaxID=395010 RepID=A0ABR0E9L1_ZASCE|nr:hypothetical protein PRZ48_010762 [Zasmidium cellare]
MNKRNSPPPDQFQSKRLKSGIDSDDDMDDTTQLVPMISRSETDPIQRQYKRDSAMADEDSDDEFVDAPEEITRGDLNMPPPPPSQDEILDVSDGQDDDDDEDTKSDAASEDLWAKHFGGATTQKKDDDVEDDDDTKSTAAADDLFTQAFVKGKTQKPDDEDSHDEHASDTDSHAKGCNTTYRRPSTPPVPTPDLTITGAVTKKSTPPKPDGPDKKEDGRIRLGPDIDRDLSVSLRMHFRFHDRVYNLVPRLNAPDFEWSRRYWIAVLTHTKQAKNATNEKDFVWMKGNRLSTGKTILHKYAETTMVDVEATVLMLGHERLGERDTMEECDFFGDRLVVLRAVEVEEGDGVGKLRERSLVEGLVKEVPEVVEID